MSIDLARIDEFVERSKALRTTLELLRIGDFELEEFSELASTLVSLRDALEYVIEVYDVVEAANNVVVPEKAEGVS